MKLSRTFLKVMKQMFLALFVIGFIVMSFPETKVYAGKSTQVEGMIYNVSTDSSLLEKADAKSPKVASLSKGDMVFVTGESGDFYEVYYQGKTAYILKENVGNKLIAEESSKDKQDEKVSKEKLKESGVNKKELNEEFENHANADEIYIDSYLAQMRAKRNAFIWRTVIIVLIVVAIAAPFVTKLFTKKDSKDSSKNEKENEAAYEADHTNSVL